MSIQWNWVKGSALSTNKNVVENQQQAINLAGLFTTINQKIIRVI